MTCYRRNTRNKKYKQDHNAEHNPLLIMEIACAEMGEIVEVEVLRGRDEGFDDRLAKTMVAMIPGCSSSLSHTVSKPSQLWEMLLTVT